MSKMSNEFLRTADDRARSDADEVAWLRDEVTRLEGVVARAALLLDEGDPIKRLGDIVGALRAFSLGEDADDLREMAATLARTRALLVSACP